MFGKTVRIEDMVLSPRTTDPMQWIGTLIIRELGPDADFAPAIRQEGSL